jgi:hypothetical protein
VNGKLPVLTDEPNKDTAVRVSRDQAHRMTKSLQFARPMMR